MKKDYTKTDRIVLLLHALSIAPRLTLSESKVLSILGNPSRAQWYKDIIFLTSEVGERKAILIKIEDDEGNVSYQLNQNDWYSYLVARKQLEFVLNSYRELGHLFPKFEIEGVRFNSKNFDRKFYYLCKNKTKFNSIDKNEFVGTIIKALIGHTKLLITYKGLEDNSAKTNHIFPLTLTQYRDDLYLVAMKEEDKIENIRTYKISRITKIIELKEKFKYPNETKWNPREYFRETSGIISGKPKKAVYRVFDKSRLILSEKQIFDSNLISSSKNYDEYECTYTNIEEFIGLLFIYGQDIEIVESLELKRAFREKAKKILTRNE